RKRQQPMHDRQKERRRLATAGHRAGHDVATFHGRRNRLGLDLRRLREPHIPDSREQLRVYSKFIETHLFLRKKRNGTKRVPSASVEFYTVAGEEFSGVAVGR